MKPVRGAENGGGAMIRILDTKGFQVRFLFEPRYLWVGAFWEIEEPRNRFGRILRLYLCLVPTVPIQLSFALE